MQKRILVIILIVFSSAIALIFFTRNMPFGWMLTLGTFLLMISVIASLFILSHHLWRKGHWKRILAIIVGIIPTLLIMSYLAILIDYRVIAPFTKASRLTQDEWNSDLIFFKEHLMTHPGINESIQNEINASINGLRSEATSLTRDQVIVEMMRLVGLFKDGHSFVPPFQVANKAMYYPLRGYWFSDGYYILDAPASYKELIHKRILKYGGYGIVDVSKMISDLSGPENEWNAKYRLDFYLNAAFLMESLGVAGHNEVSITYLDNNQQPKTIEVTTESFLKWMFWSLTPSDTADLTSLGLKKEKFKLVDLDDYIVLTINQLQDNSPTETIQMMAEELMIKVSDSTPKPLVIDLRCNTGGNNQLYQPIIDVLVASPQINQPEQLFVFTSRNTFSAAINFLDDLNHFTNATIIGEPPGAGATHYGDATFKMLPHSGIYFFLSTRTWQGNDSSYSSNSIIPDIRVEYSFENYQNREDPWVKALSNYLN